jgi:peptide/nickel transport system substrate-binding protein
MARDSTDREEQTGTTRRDYLRVAGIAGAGLVAGCTQGDSGGDGGDGGSNVVDETMTLYIVHHRPNRQSLNPWASTSIRPITTYFNMAPVASDQTTGEYKLHGLESWSVGETSMTATLHEDLKWHNGNQVTADDVIANHKLRVDTKTISDIGDFTSRDSITKTGEKSFELEYDQTVAPQIMKYVIYDGLSWLNTDVFGSYVERFDDATSDSERETITGDLAEEEMTWEDADDHGTGLFRHVETGREQVTLERWDDHYWSDRVNWSEVRFEWTPEGQMLPNLQNEQYTSVRATGITSMEDANAVPDSYIRNRQLGTGGWCLVLQHDDEIFGDQRVRKAIAHISDTETVADNAGAFRNAPAPQQFTGMAPKVQDEYVGDIIDSYTTYDDPDRATELLQEAGFTQDGGEWYRPDGERFSAEIKVPTTPEVFGNTGRSFASQARKFGIDLQVLALETSNYWSDFPGGDFRLAVGFWGSGTTTNPYRALGRTTRGNSVPSQGANIDLTSVSAPPVGEPDGEMQTYDLTEAFTKASQGDNFEEQIRTISWCYNYMVPVVPGTQRYRGSFHMDEGWSWPDLDDDVWQVMSGMVPSETNQGTASWPIWSGNVEAQ